MTTREPMLIGPFIGGLNNYDDQSSIRDNEAFEALNFDLGTDGSLKSRPPMIDINRPIDVTPGVSPDMLGYYYDDTGVPYLIATDGDSTTYEFHGGAWNVITTSIAASAMTQFDGKAWLVAPPGSSNPGGSWTPSGGFSASSTMPKGDSIVAYKARLFIAAGQSSGHPTRMYYSKVLGQSNFWDDPAFLEVGSGDGQAIVKIVAYFDSILAFRTESIWEYSYGTDPATASVSIAVPGVGLTSKNCLAVFESYIYFMYDENMYELANNKANKINNKVVFKTENTLLSEDPYAVSIWNNRVICSFFENIYVFSLRTRTWTRWYSPTWGSVGKFLSPASDKPNREGFLFSKSGVNRSEYDRNLVWNPLATKDTKHIGASTNATSVARSTSIPDTRAGHCVTYRPVEANKRTTLRYENMVAPPAGTELTLKMKIRVQGAGSYEVLASVNFIESNGTAGYGNGTIIPGSHHSSTYPTTGNEWVDVSYTFTVPSDVYYIRCYAGVQGGLKANQIIAVDEVSLTKHGEYFDGDMQPSGLNTYAWAGTKYGSPSIKYLGGTAPLLRIDEEISEEGEQFQCILITKNYSFTVPGSFKVLFWWGLDAIFRSTVKGYATPVTYASAVTWGHILRQGKTWRDLLGGTWAHPMLPDPSVETEVTSAENGLARKFVKFLKKLRFRQISFEVIFDTDGSYATAPIMLFTLSAYMAKKPMVTQQVS